MRPQQAFEATLAAGRSTLRAPNSMRLATADSAIALELHERAFRPGGGNDHADIDEPAVTDTSIADYVWLPIRFEGDRALIDWRDEWRTDDFA